MSLKHVFLIVAILLTAILVVGLIYCRPMAASGYAYGVFNFDAVDEISISLRLHTQSGVDLHEAVLTDRDEGFDGFIDLFDGRGFGRTVGSIFSKVDSGKAESDTRWRVSFSSSVSGASLTAVYVDGELFLVGDGEAEVTTNGKSEWTSRVLTSIKTLLIPQEDDPEGTQD